MRPTIFLFFLVRKERRCRARYQKEKNAGRGQDLYCLDLSLADNIHDIPLGRKRIAQSRSRPRKASLTLAPLAGS